MSIVNTSWLTLFCIAALVFFSVAGIITFFGIKDMKDLLSKSDRKDPANKGMME